MTQTAFTGLVPIGYVENDAVEVADVPSEGLPSRVRLHDEFIPALDGVEVGDHIYVIAEFDKADPTVLHGSPGTAFQQGAFSIRSSSRPNRIGLTLSRVTDIIGGLVSLEWLDFSHGSPVLDIKRYNWRWEVVLAARRLDRRHIEKQIPLAALQDVLTRPAVNFHGERCQTVENAAQLAAKLVHQHDIWLGSTTLIWHVLGDGHLIDAIQGLTGATHGNGRLVLPRNALRSDAPVVKVIGEEANLSCLLVAGGWQIDRVGG